MPRLARRGENRDTLTRLARLLDPRVAPGGAVVADPNWTHEEAWTEHERAISIDPSRSGADPTLPYFQWVALQTLKNIEVEFCNGDGWALMRAISECARCGLPLPDWAATAYLRAFRNVLKEGSWDAVFGSPYPPGTQRDALRKMSELSIPVLLKVREIINSEPNTAIDSALFERVGKCFCIGKTTTAKYYYHAEKWTNLNTAQLKRKLLSGGGDVQGRARMELAIDSVIKNWLRE